MRAEFLWEVFTDTGAPEAYLLFKDAGRAQQSVRKAEHGLPDDAGACPPPNYSAFRISGSSAGLAASSCDRTSASWAK